MPDGNRKPRQGCIQTGRLLLSCSLFTSELFEDDFHRCRLAVLRNANQIHAFAKG